MHTQLSRRAGGVVVIAITLGTPLLASAVEPGLKADSQALEWVTGSVQYTDTQSDTTLPGPAETNATAALPTGNSSTTSNACADFGLLEVTAQSFGLYTAAAGQLVNAQAISTASFKDDSVVVSAPGYGPGDFGSFTASFDLNNNVSLHTIVVNDLGGRVDITGAYELNVQFGNTIPGPYAGQWYSSTAAPDQQPNPPTGIIQVPVNFEYGVPFTMSGELQINLFVSTLDGINAHVDANMDLSSAFFWMGIDTTTLPAGATVNSEDVIDWTRPYPDNVPAPATLTLLTLGAAPFSRRRRR